MTSKAAKPLPLVPRKIVICAYEDANLMDISGPLQAFSDARFGNGRPAYQVTWKSTRMPLQYAEKIRPRR
jgi:hypothetical protein